MFGVSHLRNGKGGRKSNHRWLRLLVRLTCQEFILLSLTRHETAQEVHADKEQCLKARTSRFVSLLFDVCKADATVIICSKEV